MRVFTTSVSTLAMVLIGVLAPGCGGAEAIDGSLPPGTLAPADWESDFADEELTVWREGQILALPDREDVTLEDLAPCPGATVELLAARPDGSPPLRRVASTVTDGEGRFRVGPGPASRWLIAVTKEGFARGTAGDAPRTPGVMPLPDGPGLSLGIRPAKSLRGALVGADGEPASGVEIDAVSTAYRATVATDSKGRFEFSAPAGSVVLTPRPPEFQAAAEPVDFPRRNDVTLRPPAWEPLRGWVEARESGRPIAGAVVLLVERPDVRTTTDERGRFELPAPRYGRVAAMARGFGWRSVAVPLAGEAELRLSPGRSLSGRVVDSSGRGVADARVLAVTRGVDSLERLPGPRTGPDGGFTLSWLPRPPRGLDAPTVVLAVRRGMAWSPAVRVAGDMEPVELVLPGERDIAGVARRHGGAHLAAVEVQVEWKAPGLDARAASVLGYETTRWTQTDGDGALHVVGLPRGVALDVRYRVDGGHLTRRLGPDDVDASLVLDAGQPISGSVVDVNGTPVAGPGEVTARALNHPQFSDLLRTVELTADGTFAFEDLPVGEYGLSAIVSSWDVGGTVVATGTRDAQLVAERPVTLTFEAVFPEGAEPLAVTVRLTDRGDPLAPLRTATIPAGAADLRGQIEIVRHGTYAVTARAGAYRARIEDLVVVDGTRPVIPLHLERTLVVTARLRDADGSPLPGQRIRVRPLDSQTGGPETHQTGAGGLVELSGLATGTWEARAVLKGRPMVARTFAVGAEASPELDLRVPPYGTLVIEVAEEAWREGLVASLETPGGETVYGWGPAATKLAARFRVRRGESLVLLGIPAGAVVVQLRGEGRDVVRSEAQVRDGERTRLRLP